MELLKGMVQSGCEGNISWFENRQKKMRELIDEIKPTNLIQIGFNLGHSALLICEKIKEKKNEDESYANKKINFYKNIFNKILSYLNGKITTETDKTEYLRLKNYLNELNMKDFFIGLC